MKRLRRDEQGQAVVELALVVFVFALFTTGIIQLIWIGTAQMKCQAAAREAAKHVNLFNQANWEKSVARIQRLLPGCRVDPQAPGNWKEEGRVVTVRYTVRPIGFFHLLRPQGFEVSAKSAVIAYIETPKAADLAKKGFDSLMSLINDLKN
jgi:hypothetical protein